MSNPCKMISCLQCCGSACLFYVSICVFCYLYGWASRLGQMLFDQKVWRLSQKWRYDIKHNDTQHDEFICNIQQEWNSAWHKHGMIILNINFYMSLCWLSYHEWCYVECHVALKNGRILPNTLAYFSTVLTVFNFF